MSDGQVIRGVMFTDEKIAELEKRGLTGKLRDLHLSYRYVFSFYCTARGCYDAYMVIFKAGIRTEQDISLPVHHFRHFFKIVESSLHNNAITSIFKLIDPDPKALSLKSFIVDLRDNQHLFNNIREVSEVVDKCEEDLKILQSNKDVVELLKYRHNYVSHQSNKMTYEKYWLKNNRFLIGTPRKVLNSMYPIFEKLHTIFSNESVESNLYFKNSGDEASQVLDFLSKHLV